MKNKLKACILSFSDIDNDRRVLREIEAAIQKYQVEIIGYGELQPKPDIKFIRLEKNNRSFFYLLRYGTLLVLGYCNKKFYENAFWLKPEYHQAVHYISKGNYDFIHANDWDSLPVAVVAARSQKLRILFDAHEFSPEQESDNLLWRIFVKPFKVYIFNQYLKYAKEIITISPGIANLFLERFKVSSQIVMNAPIYQKEKFSPTNDEQINIIHHGMVIPNRHLEEMIKMMAYTDERFKLHFMLVAGLHKDYLDYLKIMANKISPRKIEFHEPVKPSQIISNINQYDLGIPFLKTPHLNIYYSLPNKFFDFIMAGLGIVIPPLPSMAEIIQKYQIGKIGRSQSLKDMAHTFNSLTCQEIDQFKHNSLKLAKSFNAENEKEKLSLIYDQLLCK